MDTLPALFTANELTQYLQVKPETVRNIARKGVIPAFKVECLTRFSKDEIETWLKNQKAKRQP
jgi:excisionase family DNA binding protein